MERYRVVNSRGEIAIKNDEQKVFQKSMLLAEGIKCNSNNCIDLKIYQFHPSRVDFEWNDIDDK